MSPSVISLSDSDSDCIVVKQPAKRTTRLPRQSTSALQRGSYYIPLPDDVDDFDDAPLPAKRTAPPARPSSSAPRQGSGGSVISLTDDNDDDDIPIRVKQSANRNTQSARPSSSTPQRVSYIDFSDSDNDHVPHVKRQRISTQAALSSRCQRSAAAYPTRQPQTATPAKHTPARGSNEVIDLVTDEEDDSGDGPLAKRPRAARPASSRPRMGGPSSMTYAPTTGGVSSKSRVPSRPRSSGHGRRQAYAPVAPMMAAKGDRDEAIGQQMEEALVTMHEPARTGRCKKPEQPKKTAAGTRAADAERAMASLSMAQRIEMHATPAPFVPPPVIPAPVVEEVEYCGICAEDLKAPDQDIIVSLEPCGHEMHRGCLRDYQNSYAETLDRFICLRCTIRVQGPYIS